MGDSSSLPLELGTASPQSSTAAKSGMVPAKPAPPSEDPLCPVKGMYRLLDLITEQGSSGLGNSFFVTFPPHSRYPHS
jgi:hypothetical protein